MRLSLNSRNCVPSHLSIQRKKDAFQRSIRQQHLQHLFHSVRQQLVKPAPKETNQDVHSQTLRLIDGLPESACELVDLMADFFQTVSTILMKHIDSFCSKIVRLKTVEWCHMVHIVNRLLVGTDGKADLEKIVGHSMLPVLEGGEILLKGASPLELGSLTETALEYCYRLGKYAYKPNQLQENALVQVLRTLWLSEWQREQETKLIMCTVNILSSQYSEEEIENVKPSDLTDLQVFKITLITQLLYKDEKKVILARIMNRLLSLTHSEQDEEMEELYLRLLIGMTIYLNNPCYYYPLISLHVLTVIGIITCLRSPTKGMALSFAIRLLNNLVVNEWKLTQQILEGVMMSRLVQMHMQNSSRPYLQIEIAELFINLLHFMNDDQEVVRQLVNLGVGELMLSTFQMDDQLLYDNLLEQTVSTLLIMYSHHPLQIQSLLAREQNLLSKTIDRHPHIAPLLENLLLDALPKEPQHL